MDDDSEEFDPRFTSILTGQRWVQELLGGHPERIRNSLGVHKSVFRILVTELQAAGYRGTRHITVEEQLAIFLWTCVTGASIPHVADRFQRPDGTIQKYFKLLLGAFSSGQIYRKYVRLPTVGGPTPTAIAGDPHFSYFKDAVGAIGSTHIPCISSAAEQNFTSQNCLVCCDFDMKFTYVLSGWEGPTADGTVYHDARVLNELAIPPGKYYLADLGFPNCPEFLVPYPGEGDHLAEWGPAQIQPVNHRELFNLRHSQLYNVMERIIGVLNTRFRILISPPEYDVGTQALIPIACCCIHNIIRTFDSAELEDMEDVTQDELGPESDSDSDI